MEIDININYVPGQKSNGSAVYIDEMSLFICNFTVFKEGEDIIIDYPGISAQNPLTASLERESIELIRKEYKRLSA